MDCNNCGNKMTFIPKDDDNGLKGMWDCPNKECIKPSRRILKIIDPIGIAETAKTYVINFECSTGSILTITKEGKILVGDVETNDDKTIADALRKWVAARNTQ